MLTNVTSILTFGKAFNARLATPEEVEKAWKQGADWCNYGCTEGQQALYPTQQATYDKLQGSEEHAHDCGVVGVNDYDVTVLPYNREQWDEKRTVMERVDDWMRPDKAREATETKQS